MKAVKEVLNLLLLSWFWGTACYLYKLTKGDKFCLKNFFITLFLAFFVWYLAGIFIPNDFEFKDWIIAICWFISYQIVEFIDKYWIQIIKDFNNYKK
jgi:hypothetical protein